jgi:DNA-binding response OmpR family regulator
MVEGALWPGMGLMDVAESRKPFNYREHVLYARTPISLVCISDRESRIKRLLLEHLEREGFGIRFLLMGTDVVQRVEQLHPSLIVIEIAMTSGRALQLCRQVRWTDSLSLTPVILIAANPSEEERILGLESGADEYIVASASGREALARVRAVMRRFARQQRQAGLRHVSPRFLQSFGEAPSPTIRTGHIEINTMAMKTWVRGVEIETTNLEFRFLHYLAQNQDRVFTREQLLDAVWGSQFVELRSVDACVRRLRRKIEPNPLQPSYLRTVRGAGYSFMANPGLPS